MRVAPHVKRYHGRYGPNKVFGTDVDARKDFTDEQAEARFMECWKGGLAREVGSATLVDVDNVMSMLQRRQQQHVDRNSQHRILRYGDLQFVVQIHDGEVSQLWFVPTVDANPKLLRVVFNTVDEREKFKILAQKLGWDDEELGLELVQDFINKQSRTTLKPDQ